MLGTPTKAAALAGAMAVLSAVGVAEASAQTDWTALRTLNIAHQGGENEAPSNTMYSYDRAMRLGADMLELDIHTTADGHVVVLHDGTVDRTTNGSGSVYDMTLQEVQRLDAGYNFVPGLGTRSGRPAADYPFRGVRTGERRPPPGFKPRDFRIPALTEVLDAYPDVPTNIEIKGAADTDLASFIRNADALAALLNASGRSEGIIVASFNDLALQRFHQLAPQIDLAPGVAGVAAFKLAGVPPPPGTVAFQVPIEFQGIPVTDPDFIQRAHDGGYAVHVWTINDETTMRQLFEWGVDGVMSAETARLEAVLCADGISRPPRPSSFPGRHCNHRRASIACDVRPRGRARLQGTGRLRVRLVRHDDFEGRCAGIVRLRFVAPRSGRSVGRGRFAFGKHAPGAGGPRRVAVDLVIPPAARRAVRTGSARRVRVVARPYAAFPGAATLPLR